MVIIIKEEKRVFFFSNLEKIKQRWIGLLSIIVVVVVVVVIIQKHNKNTRR